MVRRTGSDSTKLYAVMLVIICTVIMSFSQILLKIGSSDLSLNIFSVIMNFPLMLGYVLYGICALLLVIAFRGGELSVIYPILALSFVFVNILAWLMLGEEMNILKWLGISAIVIGVSLIGLGSSKYAGDAA